MVLPKRLRDNLQLKGGDKLTVEVRGSVIELRAFKPAARLERVNGILVLIGKTSLPEGRDFVDEFREDQIQSSLRIARRS